MTGAVMMRKEVSVCLAIGLLAFGLQGCDVMTHVKHANDAFRQWNATMPNATAAWGMASAAAQSAASYMPNANMSVPGFLGNMSLASIASLPGMPVGHTCTDVTTCQAMATAAAANAASAAQAAAAVHAEAAVAAAASGGVLNVTMTQAVAAADAAKAEAENAASMAEQATEAADTQAIEAAAVTTTAVYVGVPAVVCGVCTAPNVCPSVQCPAVAPLAACVNILAAAVNVPACKCGTADCLADQLCTAATSTCAVVQTLPARLYAISGAISKYHAHAAVAVKAANYAVVSGGVVGLTALLTLLVLRIRNSAPIPAHEQDELLSGREERGEQINIE